MDKEKLGESFYKGTITDETLAKANAILVTKCANLEQQVKKQKEVINKIQMIITDMQLELIKIKPYHSYVVDGNIIRNTTKNIEDILKEVSK